MREENALLDQCVADFERPHGQAHLETELDEMLCAMQSEARFAFFAADQRNRAVARSHLFGEVIEHHRAPERCGQRCNEKTVVATCTNASNGSRRVPTEAVRHEPLTCDEVIRLECSVAAETGARRCHRASPSAVGVISTLAWPGMRQPSSVSMGGVPVPP